MAQMAWSFPAGQIHHEVTSVTLVNNTAKTVDSTVPAGKAWRLRRIKVVNPDDVNRNLTVYVYKEAAKTNLLTHIQHTKALTAAQWFDYNSSIVKSTNAALEGFLPSDMVLDAGCTISVTWAAGGASTGGTDADGLVIEYEEVALSA